MPRNGKAGRPRVKPPRPAEKSEALSKARIGRELDGMHNAFIETLCKTDELKIALSQVDPANVKAHQFLCDILNPLYAKWTTSQLAARNGVSPSALADIWRRYNLSHTMIMLAKHAPKVAEHMAKEAQYIPVVCQRCDGWGKISKTEFVEGEQAQRLEKDCPHCSGTGVYNSPGSNDARKLMYSTLGLTQNKLVVDFNLNPPAPESIIDEIERATLEPVFERIP